MGVRSAWVAWCLGALAAGAGCNSRAITPAPTKTDATDTSGADSVTSPDTDPDSETGSDTGPDTDAAPDSLATDSLATDSIAPDTTTDTSATDTPGETDETGEVAGPGACAPTPAWIADVQVTRNGRFATLHGLPAGDVPTRDLTVYLPEAYDADREARFPVLYMHDGQNLFDEATSAYGEWRMDETVDALTTAGDIGPLVIVGIPNNDDRIAEYTPMADPDWGGGHGVGYVKWLVEVVKPAIDASFRTECAPESTGVMGSSLGGLISLWMAMEPPANAVFGRFGVVSPSLWWNDEALAAGLEGLEGPAAPGADAPAAGTFVRPTRLWLDMGTNEPDEATPVGTTADSVHRARRVRDRLEALGMGLGNDLGYLEDLGAGHNEAAWAARLPAILRSMWGAPMTGKPDALQIRPWADGVYLSVRPQIGVSVEAAFGTTGRLTVTPSAAQLASNDDSVLTLTGGDLHGVAAGVTSLSASWHGAAVLIAMTVHDASLVPLRFIVHVPAFTDRVYVAGSPPVLGPWDPGRVALAVKPPLGADLWTVEVPIPSGSTVNYKYTRGTWNDVEINADGTDRSERTAGPFTDAGVLQDDVVRWHDF